MPSVRTRPRRQDASTPYEYPAHLRAQVESLPAAPGVYVFHGAGPGVPLYIGKSVNLRSRVLSHLRNPQEARMLRQTQRISHERTAGEIGALLLEARLIKERQPLLNQRLRRSRQLCSLRLDAGVPRLVHARDVNFATEPGLYGLFGSPFAAHERLRALADERRLCLVALGLERAHARRGCFRAALGQCAGVCRGAESRSDHDRRLLEGLERMRLACWPYPGAIGVVERDDALCQIHVVRNWCHLGSVPDLDAARALSRVDPGFEADGYKILCTPIVSGRVEVVRLG
jgi:excinuclease Cho